jgi:tripartite-type tricarboxylate transporter receptor subunit TctC
MSLPRRQFLQLAAGAAALPAVSRIVGAQTYPARPITMIVPFAPGGPTDVVGRVVVERMKASLGQPIIIENIGGAEGSIGVGRATRTKPDGYTVCLGDASTLMLNGALYSLQYDLLNDFEPVVPLVTAPTVMFAAKNSPANDLRDFIAWLKANPNKSSAGIVSAAYHMLTALFRKETGTQFPLVPYRGSAPAMQDLLAGQIDLLLAAPVFLPLVRAGSIKAYAVTTEAPMALAPDIPTFEEMGLSKLTRAGWYGLFAPKGTPKDIIGKLNMAAMNALADPAVQSRFIELGFEVFPRERQTAEMLGETQKADAEKWWPIIKELGIKVE